MRKAVLLLSACLAANTFYGQVRNLFFNSYDNIGRLDFSIMPPVMYYTGISNGFEGIAHVEDDNGNVLFFVNDDGVYRGDGSFMGGSTGILIDPSTTEIEITEIPGQPGRYYVIYNAEYCSPLYYSIVDMNLAGNDGDVTALNTQIHAGSFSEGLEIIQKPCSKDIYLLTYECDAGIRMFDILNTGISNDTLLAALPIPAPINPNSSIYEGRGEFDYHNGRIGIAFTFTPYAFFADFDPYTTAVTNPVLVNFSPPGTAGMYGLEFSPDGSKAYVTSWYEKYNHNLFQYNFSTGTVTGYNVFSDALDQFYPATGPGQIELGPDGNVYVILDGGNEYIRISYANSPNPQLTYMPVNTTLGMGISDHTQSELFAPDTFDIVLCSDSAAILYAPGIPASSYTWSTGDTGSSIAVSEPGIYTLTINGQCPGVRTYEVYSANPEFATQLVICPGDTQQIGHAVPGASYQWNTGDTIPFITPSSTGLYILEIDVPQCQTESDSIFVIIKQAVQDLAMPNVFTPNGDLVNDTYQPVNPPLNEFIVYIYDRWGRKLSEIKDFANGWNGKSPEGQLLPDGVYYWVAEQHSECQAEPVTQNGFFHILDAAE